MTYDEKKYLYESIMKTVAKTVKQHINELKDDKPNPLAVVSRGGAELRTEMLDVHAEEIAESISTLDNWPFIKKMFNNALIYADINGPEFAIEFFKKITKNIR